MSHSRGGEEREYEGGGAGCAARPVLWPRVLSQPFRQLNKFQKSKQCSGKNYILSLMKPGISFLFI